MYKRQHQGDFSNDQNWRFTMWTYRAFWKWLHAFGIHSPSSPIRNTFKRHKVERNYVKWIRERGIALICGHTHRAKFPASDETPYFNSGSCTFNAYVTGLEIVNGEISLVRWRVESDANGYLHVVRWVLAGPRPLSDYDRLRRPGLSADEETDRHEAIRARSRRVPPRKDAGVPDVYKRQAWTRPRRCVARPGTPCCSTAATRRPDCSRSTWPRPGSNCS